MVWTDINEATSNPAILLVPYLRKKVCFQNANSTTQLWAGNQTQLAKGAVTQRKSLEKACITNHASTSCYSVKNFVPNIQFIRDAFIRNIKMKLLTSQIDINTSSINIKYIGMKSNIQPNKQIVITLPSHWCLVMIQST